MGRFPFPSVYIKHTYTNTKKYKYTHTHTHTRQNESGKDEIFESLNNNNNNKTSILKADSKRCVLRHFLKVPIDLHSVIDRGQSIAQSRGSNIKGTIPKAFESAPRNY